MWKLSNTSNLAQAQMLSGQGDAAETEMVLRQVSDQMTSMVGKQHPLALSNMGNSAAALMAQGKHAEAEQIFRQIQESMDNL